MRRVAHAIGGDRLRSSRDRAGRRDPRRRAGHAHAFRDAEAAAPGVRPADDRLAGGGGAGGRRRARSSSSRARTGRSTASLDGEVTVAVQQEPRGTADAVKAAAAHIDPADTVIVLNGDHPLITAETLDRAGAGARAHRARRRRWPRRCSRTRAATAGWCGRPTAPSSGWSRPRRRATPRELELQIREINTGIFAFEGAALLAALEEVRSDNAQGELYLPDVLPIMRAHERTVIAHEIADASELGVNDRVAAGRGAGDRPAADPRAPHARRRDDRRSGARR